MIETRMARVSEGKKGEGQKMMKHRRKEKTKDKNEEYGRKGDLKELEVRKLRSVGGNKCGN